MFGTAIAAVILSSCQRTEKRAVQRVAVLPFENLTADPALDWVGPAVASMLNEQASASVRIYPYRAEAPRDARLTGAARIVQGYYVQDGSRIKLHAVVEDLQSNRNAAVVDAVTDLGGASLNAASESMASVVSDRIRPFGTQNGAAIKAWGEALAARDISAKIAGLRRAIETDPNFGTGYVDLASLYVSANDAAAVQQVLKQADDHLSRFTDLERARLEFIESGIRQDPRQRREALMALSRLVSTDPQTLRALAEAEVNAKQFDVAVDVYKSAVSIEPGNADQWNELGYAEAYRGNLDAARAALERYRVLQPNQPNASDSLGEICFMSGRFAEAEKYFLEAQRMQPGYLGGVEFLKAAQARYLAGDLAGADGLYAEFDKLRQAARDPVAGIRRAEWLHVTGRGAEAMSAAETVSASPNADLAAYAFGHLALWAADAGDTVKAVGFAQRASQVAKTPNIQAMAALCRLIVSPQPQMPDLARAYSSILVKNPASAGPVLKMLYDTTPPSADGDIRTLYASALADSGRVDEARSLLKRYYIPIGAGNETLLSTATFPHFVALRAKLMK